MENGAEAQIFTSASPEDVMTLVGAGHCRSSALAGGTLSIYHGSEAVLVICLTGHLSRWIVGSPESPIGQYTRQFLTSWTHRWPRTSKTMWSL